MLEIWVFVNCKIYHIQLTLTDDVTKEISTQMTIYAIIDEPTASKSKVASLTVPSLQSPRDPVSFVISQQMGVSDGHTSQTKNGWMEVFNILLGYRPVTTFTSEYQGAKD